MKKVIVALAALLLLCGCSSPYSTKVSEGNVSLYESPDGKAYTKQDAYNDAKKFDIATKLTNDLTLKIAKLEGIDTSSFKKEAEDYIQSIVDQGYEEFIAYYYGSKEAYIEQSVVYGAVSELAKKDIEADFDSYLASNNPYKAAIVYFDNEDSAKGVLETMEKDKQTFAYSCTENGYGSEVVETIYRDSDTDLPSEVKQFINTNESGVSPVIKVDEVTTDADGNSTTNSRYYLVNLVSKDVNTFKDEFLNLLAAEANQNEIISDSLKKYELTVHDQDIYDVLSGKFGDDVK